MTADPFGTRPLREAVLAAWATSPARFREDANSEEDHARGHYRDRVVVELAQNAADAGPRLLLRLTPDALVAANTGHPLDAAGVASLASLRASAKRGGSGVGRFGVGFAAVRSVSDDVTVATRQGAVTFGLAATRTDLAAVPALTEEVAARGDALPVLRLPRPAPVPPEAGELLERWDTVVVLRLRDAAARAVVAAQLAAVGDPLLLALPGLAEVTIETDTRRTLRDVTDRWVLTARTGELPPALVATLPVEERARPGWQVTWAVPRTGAPADHAAPVVHAPTPTEEPGPRTALLLATFPLDPGRRHVAAGPVTDHLVTAAGDTWGDLLLACVRERAAGRPAPEPWSLLPRTLPTGPLDAALREAVLAASRRVPALPGAGGGLLAPDAARVVEGPLGRDPEVLAVLGARFADLADPPTADLVRLLGLEPVAVADLLQQWPDTDPAALRALYDALAPRTELEDLATVPVRLVTGRVVHGARGLVVPDAVPTGTLAPLAERGARLVDPGCAHPLLLRLGAEPAAPGDLARHPVVRAAVAAEDEEIWSALAALVAAAGQVEPEPWWGDVLLPTEGDLAPARELVVPGSRAEDILERAWFRPAEPVASEDTLVALGVRRDLVLRRVTDPDPDAHPDVADLAEYLEEADLDPGTEILVVADLDGVRDRRAALVSLSGPLAAALAPVRTSRGPAPSYASWWLRARYGLRPFAVTGTPPALEAVLGPPPAEVAGLAREAQVLLGGVASEADLDAEGWADLVDALVEGEPVEPWFAAAAWRALVRDPDVLGGCAVLPALTTGGLEAVATDAVAVADPMWAGHPGVRPVVVVPRDRVAQTAEELDVEVAHERAAGRVTSTGRAEPVPSAVGDLFPQLPDTWWHHAPLLVDGERVPWWVEGEGRRATVHVGDPAALATALAAVGAPAAVVAALLAGADPGRAVVDLAGHGC